MNELQRIENSIKKISEDNNQNKKLIETYKNELYKKYESDLLLSGKMKKGRSIQSSEIKFIIKDKYFGQIKKEIQKTDVEIQRLKKEFFNNKFVFKTKVYNFFITRLNLIINIFRIVFFGLFGIVVGFPLSGASIFMLWGIIANTMNIFFSLGLGIFSIFLLLFCFYIGTGFFSKKTSPEDIIKDIFSKKTWKERDISFYLFKNKFKRI